MNLFQLVNACPNVMDRVTWDTAPVRQPEPYAILHAGPESVLRRFHGEGRVLIEQSLDVTLYHVPGERTPPQVKLLAAYEWILSRRGHLSLTVSGQRLTVCNLAASIPPTFDNGTQGLWASISFGVQFIR